jgi:glycosyltransferase involved in cell wall biosynthesis
MPTVVMIAHGFPPEGNAGAYRPFRFARHLPALGWTPHVVAADAASYERYDPALLDGIPAGTEVRRVRGRDPWQAIQAMRARRFAAVEHATATGPGVGGRMNGSGRRRLREFVRHVEAWCYHPDPAMTWIRPAVKGSVDLAERKGAAVLWATAGPVSAFLVAEAASRRLGIPYVLDFRDAWTITFNEFEARRPGWAVRADRRTLHRLLAGAQAVTFRYPAEAQCYWRAYPGALDPARVHIIPNGYDGSVEPFVQSDGERCTILYTGTLSSYRYDTLLQGLRLLKTRDQGRAQRIRFLVVGEGAGELKADADGLGLGELVECSGPVSHADVASLQARAHALLVLGRPPTYRGYELFAGAKLFGYLRAGRPIVGVLPPDETRRILRGVGVSTIADASAPADIASVLERVVDAWAGRTLHTLVPDPSACEAYSAERQTAALVRALEGRPAAEPFMPNQVEIPPSLRSFVEAGAPVPALAEA